MRARPAARNFPYDVTAETTIGAWRPWAPAKRSATLLLTLIGFRLCDATEITVIVVVAGSAQHRGTARAQPVQQCEEESTRAKYVKSRDCFNQLKRKENALVLLHRSFGGPKIGWTDLDYKDD
jgi:hypothetical protein